jgi:thiamine-phosphate pyrophosphorylase
VRDGNAATRILVAGRPDVAMAVYADGVHLSAAPGELTPGQVRRLMPEAFVTVSCHGLAEVERARDGAASAILFGPVFGKTVAGVEVAAGIGLKALRQACAAAGDVPVWALGGVTETNSEDCVAAGASGVAAIRMFFSSE